MARLRLGARFFCGGILRGLVRDFARLGEGFCEARWRVLRSQVESFVIVKFSAAKRVCCGIIGEQMFAL